MSKRPEVNMELIAQARIYFPETKLASNRDTIEFVLGWAIAEKKGEGET